MSKLNKMCNIFKKFKLLDKEVVQVCIKPDYPITMFNNHLKVVLAPYGSVEE